MIVVEIIIFLHPVFRIQKYIIKKYISASGKRVDVKDTKEINKAKYDTNCI